MALPRVVVDTDVVSYGFKGDTRAELYDAHLLDRRLLISFMTLAELESWAEAREWGARRRSELDEHLRERYAVAHSDAELCKWWVTVRKSARRSVCPIEVADAWIAATAMLYGIPLVTHNPDDFAGVDGLTVVTERAGRAGRA
jgi:predicted nucleic acid-binding protein